MSLSPLRTIAMPEEGESARLIYRNTERPAPSWHLRTQAGARELLLEPAMRLSTLMMIREAAIHGAGVALLPRTLVAEDLSHARLTCWRIDDGGQTEIWALHAPSRLASAKVVFFLDHLESAFRRIAAP